MRKRTFALSAPLHCAFACSPRTPNRASARTRSSSARYLPLQSGLAAGATQMKEGTDAYFK